MSDREGSPPGQLETLKNRHRLGKTNAASKVDFSQDEINKILVTHAYTNSKDHSG